MFPIGKFAKIKIGPLRGYKFIVSKNSGWSPIVGRWETELQYLFTQIVKKNWTVYDLGANNGIHTLLFSKLVGSGGKVFSFEPIENNIQEIETNYSINHLGNIRIIPKAVSNNTGIAKFKIGKHDKQGSLFGIGSETDIEINVETTTLDECIDNGVSQPDLVKIDIEGAESLALEGYSKYFSEHKPTLFIELHTKEQDKKVGAFLNSHGYKAYRVTKGSRENDLDMLHLEKIHHFDQVYPAPGGFWGTVFAFHPDKINLFKAL